MSNPTQQQQQQRQQQEQQQLKTAEIDRLLAQLKSATPSQSLRIAAQVVPIVQELAATRKRVQGAELSTRPTQIERLVERLTSASPSESVELVVEIEKLIRAGQCPSSGSLGPQTQAPSPALQGTGR